MKEKKTSRSTKGKGVGTDYLEDGSRRKYIRCCGEWLERHRGDTAHTDANGYCHKGKGFYITMLCPFLCPICMDNLEQHYVDWDGYCHVCKDLTGDKWTIEDGHWKLMEHQPKMLDWQGNLQQLMKLNNILKNIGS